jgi:dephospho-CoA kinase
VRARVGLTGGIGSGKSEVARVFADLGALVIDADAMARLALAPGSRGLAAIAERWPTTLRDGALDRAALSAIVFEAPAELSALNAIVHPEVRRLSAEREASAGADRIVVHDVPLLFESGFSKMCDANVLVVADVETRIARVEARSGFARDEIERRIAAQIAVDRARALADYVIENDGTLDDLARRAADVYEHLRALAPRRETRAAASE